MKKNKKSKKWMWIVGIGILAVVIAFQFLGNQNKLAENTKTYVIKQNISSRRAADVCSVVT